MTIGTTTPLVRLVYTGPGTYAFSFRVHEDADVEVQHIDTDGVATVLTLTTDYTVTITDPAVGDGGSVTTTYSPTTGFLQIRRNMEIDQQTDWVNGDALDMETLERGFDRMAMILQQQETSIGSKASLTNLKGIWVTGTVYSPDDIVQHPDATGNYYVCYEEHTAGTFATDLAAGKWAIYIDFSTATDAAAAAAASETAAATSETNAATSETNAATSETNAATSESNASTSASNAATSEANAATSETNAATSETNAATSETNAAASETKAGEWAEKAEDSPVETGPDKYSALHWAAKAAASAASAELPSSPNDEDTIQWNDTSGEWDAVTFPSSYTRLSTKSSNYTLLSADVPGGIVEVPIDISSNSVDITELALADMGGVVEYVIVADAGDLSSNKARVLTSGASEVWTGYQVGDRLRASYPNAQRHIVAERATVEGELYLTGDNATTANTDTKILNANVSLDMNRGNAWDATTNHRFDAPFDALCEFTLYAASDIAYSNVAAIHCYLNGSKTFDVSASSTNGIPNLPHTWKIFLSAGDYLEWYLYSDFDRNVRGDAAKDETWMRWNLVRRVR